MLSPGLFIEYKLTALFLLSSDLCPPENFKQEVDLERVVAYIDGFNLYFGLKSKGWRRYYWLDLQKLVQNLLKADQRLASTRYFTARISGPPDKQKRQSTFIEALETLTNFQVYSAGLNWPKASFPRH